MHLLLVTEGVIGNLYELKSLRTAALVRVLFGDQKFEGSPYLKTNVRNRCQFCGPPCHETIHLRITSLLTAEQ